MPDLKPTDSAGTTLTPKAGDTLPLVASSPADGGTGAGGTGFPVHLQNLITAPIVKLVQPVVESLSLMRVGFTLTLVFAGILFLYLIFAVVSISHSEGCTMQKFDTLTAMLTSNIVQSANGSTNGLSKDDFENMTKTVAEAYRDTRQSTIDFHKAVIINVLLPILTGLLGYVFANKGDSNQGGK